MGVGALFIERGATRLLIDAGHGPEATITANAPPFMHTLTHAGNLPASLEQAGIDPATIAAVAFTHRHGDHVGWATADAVEGDPRSLFPFARWFVGDGAEGHNAFNPPLAGEPERMTIVHDRDLIAEGVQVWALPGHTPEHMGLVIDAGDGRELLALGDAFHAPAQIEHPEWSMAFDNDLEASELSRRSAIEYLKRDNVLGFLPHFADQQLGDVDGDGHWRPWDGEVVPL